MDQTNDSNQNPSGHVSGQMNKSSTLTSFFLIILVLLACLGCYLLGRFTVSRPEILTTETQSNSVTSLATQPLQEPVDFQPLPASQFKSFALFNQDKLMLIPLDSNLPIIDVDNNVSWGEGTIYQGDNEPVSAPNLEMVAYLKNQQLFLTSSDGQHTRAFDPNLKVRFISGWSPDSEKLIVFSTNDGIVSLFDGMWTEEAVPPETTFSSKRYPGGFYLCDVATGKITHLYPIDKFVSWINSDSVLTYYTPVPNDNWYMTFNIETFTLNTQILKDVLNSYFYPGISFNPSGSIWAVDYSPDISSPSKMVVADFPSLEGIVIEELAWASRQQPMLSPQGDRLLYRGDDGANQPQIVFLWHSDINQIQEVAQGIPQMWVDNDSFIYAVYEPSFSSSASHRKELWLYNLVDQSKLKIFPRS